MTERSRERKGLGEMDDAAGRPQREARQIGEGGQSGLAVERRPVGDSRLGFGPDAIGVANRVDHGAGLGFGPGTAAWDRVPDVEPLPDGNPPPN